MWSTLEGVPGTTCSPLPSPQSIRHSLIVSSPGSDDDRLSVNTEPSFTLDAPLIASTGATFSTVSDVVAISDSPSGSVTRTAIVRVVKSSAKLTVGCSPVVSMSKVFPS